MARRDPDPIPEEPSDPLVTNKNRRCFCFPCFPSSSSSSPRRTSSSGLSFWDRIRSNSISSSSSPRTYAVDDHPHWWDRGIRALKKIREWSEIVAGPKWKTFIRRFNRNHRGSGNNRHAGKFQYDPLSYALNFDEGQNGNLDEDDDYGGFRDFSARYAAISGSGRPLAMDATSTARSVAAKDVAVIG